MLRTYLILGNIALPPTSGGDYGIGLEQLASMTRDHNFAALELYGGVSYYECIFPVLQCAYFYTHIMFGCFLC